MSHKKFIPFFGAAVAAACLMAGTGAAEANSTDRMMYGANGTRYEFGKTYNTQGSGVDNTAVITTRDGMARDSMIRDGRMRDDMNYARANGTRMDRPSNTTRAVMAKAGNATHKAGEYADDKGIEATIKGKMIKEAGLQAGQFNVYSFNNHVFLIGALSPEHRADAERAAQNTEGVRKITTHWFPADVGNRLTDTPIEVAIDAKLLFAKNVDFTDIHVDVWGGNVVLLGTVGSQGELDRVMDAVRSVDSVKSITNYLMLHPDSNRR